MTGWRLGYTLGPAPVIAAVQKLQSQSTSNPTSIVQKAAVAALSSSQQCVADMRAEYIKLRDHIISGLRAIPGVKCTMPEGAFYAYPNLSAFIGKSGIKSSADIAHGLLHQAHVATVAGEGFGTSEHVRISYATTKENLDRALERMRKYFGSL
jgi:aspartate aminotransferase